MGKRIFSFLENIAKYSLLRYIYIYIYVVHNVTLKGQYGLENNRSGGNLLA